MSKPPQVIAITPETAEDAALLKELQTELLKDLVKVIKSGNASASEKATAAALLGKSGNLSRAGESGAQTAGGSAWAQQVASMTPEELAAAARQIREPAPIPVHKPRKESAA